MKLLLAQNTQRQKLMLSSPHMQARRDAGVLLRQQRVQHERCSWDGWLLDGRLGASHKWRESVAYVTTSQAQ